MKEINNLINFPTKKEREKVDEDITEATQNKVSHILDYGDDFKYLIEKIKKLTGDETIKSFGDLESCEFNFEDNQFIYKYKGLYGFIILKKSCDFELVKKAKELEHTYVIATKFSNIIFSWFPFMNNDTLKDITNINVNYQNGFIDFTYLGEIYTCDLTINKKPILEIVKKD